MKAISIHDLKLGRAISKDVFNDLGNIILSEGTEITERHLEYFSKHNIETVFVNDDFGPASPENAFKLLTNEKYRQMNHAYGHVLDTYKRIYYGIQNEIFEASDIEMLHSELNPLIDTLLQDNDILGSIRLVSHDEEYHLTHAVNVAMLGAMTGKWLGLDRQTIDRIAYAGLLHDLGKALIPRDLIFKTSALTAEEMQVMQTHAQKGYELFKDFPNISRDVLAAILFHHERSDGSGYPSGLKQEQTPYIARIIAVADVFDAITSNRVYKSGISSFSAFSVIKDESFRGLDPVIADVFLSNIASYFINNKVKLNNGSVGEVVYVNKYALNRPLVRLMDDTYVDLSTDYSIQIEEVLTL